MGLEYGLYDHDAKEFIWLGKFFLGGRFQLPSERLVRFLRDRKFGAKLSVESDSGDVPSQDEEAGWVKVDGWDWEDGQPPPDDAEQSASAPLGRQVNGTIRILWPDETATGPVREPPPIDWPTQG